MSRSKAITQEFECPLERLVWLVEHDGTVHTQLLWLLPSLTGGTLDDGRTWFNAAAEFP